MDVKMDAKYCREKSELCLRLADGLSLNNPGRFQLMDLAEDFMQRAKISCNVQSDWKQEAERQQQAKSRNAE
jgi:hypothetical protein